MGCKIDIDAVLASNLKKNGKRKNGLLINEGDCLTEDEAKALRRENSNKFGLTQEFIEGLAMPVRREGSMFNVADILNRNPDNRLPYDTCEMIHELKKLKAKGIKKLS